MSLNGSLDGFALPDVLVLLSTTRKSGELRVWGEQTEGSVWLADGQVVAASSTESDAPAEAVSDLLRLRGGGFSFEIGEPPEGEARSMESLLIEAQTLLDEWRVIDAVVPSLNAPVDLVAALSVPKVTIGARQWKVLLHLAGTPGASVQELRRALGLSELGAARAVKELVEAGLASVQGPTATETGERAAAAAPPEAEPAPTRAGLDVDDVWEAARQRRATPEPEPAPVRGPTPIKIPAPTTAQATMAPPAPPTAAAPAEPTAAAPASTVDGAPGNGEEPINRDVLLKFISTSRG